MKIEDVVFWILFIASIVIIIWLLIGSPGLLEGTFTLAIFAIGQTAILWKEFYSFKSEIKSELKFLKQSVQGIKIRKR